MSNLLIGTNSAAATISAANTAVEQVKSDIITGSLDVLNSKSKSGGKSMSSMQSAMSDTYDLTKSVVGAVYEGKGTIIEKLNS